MTQSTKGPENVPGGDNENKGTAARRDPPATAPKSPAPAQASGSDVNRGRSLDSPARPTGGGSPSTSGDTDRANSGGSRSPGSLPGEHSSGPRRDLVGASSQGEGRPSRSMSPTSPKGSPSERPTPSPSTGVNPARSDENSPIEAPGRGSSSDGFRSPSPPLRADSGNSPGRSGSEPRRSDRMSPQDPKPFGKGDPVQPNRSVPTQPSRVIEPTVGASDSSGDGDTKS